MWRDGFGRQVDVARAIPLVEVVALDVELGRRAGELFAKAGGCDVIDAALILLTVDK